MPKWWEKINQQYGNGEPAPSSAAAPTTTAAPTKARNWWQKLNEESAVAPPPPPMPQPTQNPIPQKQKIILPNATLSAGEAPMFSGPDFSGPEVKAPNLNLQKSGSRKTDFQLAREATMEAQAQGRELNDEELAKEVETRKAAIPRYGAFFGKVAEKLVNIPSEAITSVVNRFGDMANVEIEANSKIDKNLQPKTQEKIASDQNPLRRVGAAARAGTATVGLIPGWLAITTGLEAAKDVPVVKYPAKAISKGFELLGKAGQYSAGKAVDVAPISDESKTILRAPIEELGALASQLVGAKYGAKGVGKFKDVMTEKIKARQAAGEVITPDTAKRVLNETAKEVPVDQPPAVIRVETQGGPVPIYTNQKIVLENFIKNNEGLTYKRVKSLGTDLDGKPIAARFEWDYKRQQGTIYTTKHTDATNLAHELGHYFDRKLSGKVNEQLSSLIPEYTKNKEAVDNALAAYALDFHGADATPQVINQTINSFVSSFKSEVAQLSNRTTFNEQFADAVAKVITNPQEAARLAPEVSHFIEFNLRDKGLLAEKVREYADPAQLAREMSSAKREMVDEFVAGEGGAKIQAEVEVNQSKLAALDGPVVDGIKNSPYFRKEGSIKDAMGEGYLLEKNGRHVIVEPSQLDAYIQKGYRTKIEVEALAKEAGFERGYEYLEHMRELDQVSRLTNIEKIAEKRLYETDQNFKNLSDKITELKEYAKQERAARKTSERDVAEGAQRETTRTVETEKAVNTGGSPKPVEALPRVKAEDLGTSTKSAEPAPQLTLREREQLRFQDRPQKTVLSEEIRNGSEFKGIPPENIVHFNQGANERVSLIVSSLDKDIMGANKQGASAEMRQFVIRQIMKQGDLPEAQARTYLYDRAKELKELARSHASKENPVLLNTIQKPSAELVAKTVRKETIPVEKPKAAEPINQSPQKTPEVKTEIAEPIKTTEKASEATKVEESTQTTTQTATAEPQQPKIKVVEKETNGKFAATGLDTKKVVANRSSYNAEKINAPEDVEAIFKAVSAGSKEFKGQRMSKTDADLQALAKEVDISVDDLLKLEPGSIANAETVLKARQLVADAAQDFRDTLKTIQTETATPQQKQIVKEKLFRLQGVMKSVAGLRTEAANVFRSFKQEVMAGENDLMSSIISELKKIDATAADDLVMFTKKSKELIEPTTIDKAWHLWYMSILSGESTQIKNAFGNFTSMLGEAAVSAGRAVAHRDAKEVTTAMSGLYEGLYKGKSEFVKILKEGDSGKFAENGVKPVVFTLGNEKSPSVFRKYGAKALNAMDYVGRFMAATDAFAKEGFRGMEIKSSAYELAKKEGYKGEALLKRMDELVEKPTEQMIKEREYQAKRGTMTQDPEGVMGVTAQHLGQWAKKVPGGKLVAPFTRIVANVINNGLDWTPVGIKRALVRPVEIGGKKVFKEGGIWSDYYKEALSDRQRSQAYARGTLGTVAMAYFATLAAEGTLSGSGPNDSKKRQQMKDSGWRQNAIKIGDRWYPYQNWGPLAIPMTLVGNYFDAERYGKVDNKSLPARLGSALFGSAASIVDMSFLSGVSDLMSALKDPSQAATYLQNFVAQQTSSVVPNLVKQTARYFDPGVYETNSVWEKVMSNMRITGGLKPKLNVFGDAIKGERLTELSPVKVSSDPLIKFLAEEQIFITVPSKNTKIRGKDGKLREMSSDEYYDYVKLSGQRLKKDLTDRLDYIKQLPENRREKYIDDTVQNIRDQIKYQIQAQARQ